MFLLAARRRQNPQPGRLRYSSIGRVLHILMRLPCVNLLQGYRPVRILTPLELIYGDEEKDV